MPSLNVPLAANCLVSPAGTVAVAGFTAIDWSVAAVKFAVPLLPLSGMVIDDGLKTTPALLGVMVYEPFSKFWKE